MSKSKAFMAQKIPNKVVDLRQPFTKATENGGSNAPRETAYH